MLKDALQAKAISERSIPQGLAGVDCKVDFLTKRSRVRIINGIFYFEGIIGEGAFLGFALSTKSNPNVRIEFEDPAYGKWSAQGTMERLNAGQPRHPDLERALTK